jgi:hypothetical protein
MKQFETVQKKKTDSVPENKSAVGTLFCDNASAMYSGYCTHRTAELNKTAVTVLCKSQIRKLKYSLKSAR